MKRARRSALATGILAVLAVASAACGSDSSSATFPVELTEERVQTGSGLYAEHCSTCHGTPNVSQPVLPQAPPHDELGHTWHHPDRLLYQWILDRPPLATVMPSFRGVLTDEEVIAVLAFIKDSWPEDVQQFQNEGSAQYEQQVASE